MADDSDRSYVVWYDEADGLDPQIIGKENAGLGEMMRAGIRVSPGFCITVRANERFLEESGIKAEMGAYLQELGQATYETATKASEFTLSLMDRAAVPEDVGREIRANYQRLCDASHARDVSVAVRSSRTIWMPGQKAMYLNVKGEEDLLLYVKKCWSEAYNTDAILYRANKGMGFIFNIGVGVPKMVDSRVSGVVYTINPANGDASKIVIDASYGLGTAVVGGLVRPDRIVVDKVTMGVTKSTIGTKETMCVYREDGSDIVQVSVPVDTREMLCVTYEEIMELARLGKAIEQYFGRPHDIEFGIDRNLPFPENIIVLQVRRESIWSKKEIMSAKPERRNPLDRFVGQVLTAAKEEHKSAGIPVAASSEGSEEQELPESEEEKGISEEPDETLLGNGLYDNSVAAET